MSEELNEKTVEEELTPRLNKVIEFWSGLDPLKVSAAHFVGTLRGNVDNERLSDAEFREFVRNTLPIVEDKVSLTKDDKLADIRTLCIALKPVEGNLSRIVELVNEVVEES